MERKAFLVNPKHQYRVTQYGEHDSSAHNEKNEGYNEYPSSSHFTNELNYMKNCGNKAFLANLEY